MEVGLRNRGKNCSKSLELAATDDLPGFIHLVENGSDIDEASFWYGRSFGSKKMGFKERTPLMIASLYGSTDVLTYILRSGKVDVNRACGADGATALHCAAAGGSWPSVEIVLLLINASGDIHAVDAFGNKPADYIAPCIKSSARKTLELLLTGAAVAEPMDEQTTPPLAIEKRDYPIDVPLPDINNGIYSTDDFRMYNFKVNPCSRAYSHDWTECPFVHPGENARRRDPRKYQYTCVPCPDFKKGNCSKGDACEYAHGVFESWLHPAQYRTRLCKDETGCTRKVCFFAHKPNELRPVYASTGSGIPSPKSVTDVAALSPMSPISPSVSSPMWQGMTPPPLQLPGSRLKASLSARDLEHDLELEKIRSQQKRQQLIEEMSGLCSSPYGLRSSYPLPAVRKPVPYGFDSSAAVAAALMNSRSSAFAKRSQSFVDRPGAGAAYRPGISNMANVMPSKLGDWGSPDGKVNWGFNDEEANKLRKSVSFGIRSGNGMVGESANDMAWVDSLVNDGPAGNGGARQGSGGRDVMMPNWIDQMYMEQAY